MTSTERSVLPLDRPNHDESAKARLNEMVVGYFMRGIQSLEQVPKGPELAVRRVWSPRPQPLIGKSAHPWDS
jgi:hypothetical protein